MRQKAKVASMRKRAKGSTRESYKHEREKREGDSQACDSGLSMKERAKHMRQRANVSTRD